MFKKIKSFFVKKKSSQIEWCDIEYFDEIWKERLKVMTKYIPDNVSLMDLGCGPMWVKEFVKLNKYYPVDYKKRDDDTIVCDFNKFEFPEKNVDFAFVGGCLEYVKEFEWFIKKISKYANSCVISYCCIEQIPDTLNRRSLAWVNDLSKKEIISLFQKHGFDLIVEDNYLEFNSIFLFTRFNKKA